MQVETLRCLLWNQTVNNNPFKVSTCITFYCFCITQVILWSPYTAVIHILRGCSAAPYIHHCCAMELLQCCCVSGIFSRTESWLIAEALVGVRITMNIKQQILISVMYYTFTVMKTKTLLKRRRSSIYAQPDYSDTCIHFQGIIV